MEIVSLEIQNFGPIAQAKLNLAGQGLVNIEGDNRDDPSANSNGSGKSTIPDALYWCLFGSTARGVSGDDVIANFAGKECYVAVILQDGADRYLVERWRKKKAFKGKASGLALSRTGAGGTLVDLTQGTDKLTQEQIILILGCSEEVFTKGVYSGQEALPDLPNMTDKQIKELVEEAGGIEVLAKAYVLAREHRLTMDRAYQDAKRVGLDCERNVSDATLRLDDMQSRHDSWSGQRDTRHADKSAELSALVGQAKEIAGKRDAIDLAAEQSTLDRLRASVSAVEYEKAEERRLSDLASVAARNAASAASTLASEMDMVRRAKTHFESVDGKVGTPCGECGKAYEVADLSEAKRLAHERLKEATSKATSAKVASDDTAEAQRVANEDLLAYRAVMTDVSAAVEEMRLVSERIAEHARLNTQFDNRRADAHRVKAEVEAIKAETNPYVELVEQAKEKLDAARAGLEAARKVEAEAFDALAVADAAVAVFGPSGVRAYVLDTVTPYLNERTAHYLGTLSDGRIEAVWTTLAKNAKGEQVEKFAIEVHKVGGGSTFKALSGGEKRKVRLSCALALQDLVGSRATKAINLWIGDEIDDALDEAGLERLMAVLEEKAREKGTVLVISHNSLRDWIRETTVVTMEGGKSRVSGALV